MKLSRSYFLFLLTTLLVSTTIISPRLTAAPNGLDSLIKRGILYYDPDACAALDIANKKTVDTDLRPGKGSPEGLSFPNLEPASMAEAINKYIDREYPNSVFKGLGSTFVKGGERSNVNPFFLIALAKKESQLGNPGNYNVKTGSNAFGRTASPSQPNFPGRGVAEGVLWYKWSSPKASVDPDAAENERPSGDHSAYLKEKYGPYIEKNDLSGLMHIYAPPGSNDTPLYIKQAKDTMKALAALAGTQADRINVRDTTSLPQGGDNLENTKLYMLGDSITEGAKPLLEKGFKGENIDPYINGSVSRSILRPGITPSFKTSGLDAVDGNPDKQKIADAGYVVIALGTNADGDGSATTYTNNMRRLVEKIKEINSSAKIFAVNIFSPAVTRKNSYNEALDKLSKTAGFTVIDVASKNIQTPDNIHPNSQGQKVFADTVVQGVTRLSTPEAESGQPVDVNGGCVCSAPNAASGSTARGSNNAQIVFNFFVDKGYKPYQAAAIVGNMTHESGVEPLRQESIFNRLVKAEEFPAAGGGPGWGLVQWTPGSKMISPVKAAGKDPNDIIIQLEFLYDQLEGRGPLPETQAGQELKGTPNLEEAVKAFQGTSGAGGKYYGYERPRDQAGTIPTRTKAARETLQKYGNGAAEGPNGTVSGTGNSSCEGAGGNAVSGGNGVLVGRFSWPVPEKYVKSNFVWFTKPHHDHPSSDIPVPEKTDVYSITDGKVLAVNPAGYGGGYGAYITIEYEGALFRYQHGADNSITLKVGDNVRAGQLIMKSSWTGFVYPKGPAGTHLHVSIETGGNNPVSRTTEHCPQELFKAMKEGRNIESFTSLPTSGCIGRPLGG